MEEPETTSELLVVNSGATRTIVLNRSEKRNAMNNPMLRHERRAGQGRRRRQRPHDRAHGCRRLVRRSERRSDHDAPWRGFLIVPLFLLAVGLTMSTATGTSLVVATVLTIPTPVTPAIIGNIYWTVAALSALGPGARSARRLGAFTGGFRTSGPRRTALTRR